MDKQHDHLADVARLFEGLSDGRRLDEAAVTAGRLKMVVDLIRAGELEASERLYDRLAGAVFILEAITAGRGTATAGEGGGDV